MRFNQLLTRWGLPSVADREIHHLQNDSRLIQPGDLFLAYPGTVSDGRLFIDKAVILGASAVIYEPENFPSEVHLPVAVPCVPLPDLSRHLAGIACFFYGHPSSSLHVTGVTGTNGKTTIAYQLAQAYGLLNQRAAYIGTIGQGQVNQLNELANTTPDGLCLQKLLSQYKKDGVKEVCMEVSSHALSQNRVEEIAFKQAIFTNLTWDHLDYHHTMQAYAQAKAQLFTRPELEWIILNKEDAYYQLMADVAHAHVKKLTYGFASDCDVRATRWDMTIEGSQMVVHSPWGAFELTLQALGQFNMSNSLAIVSGLLAKGYSRDEISPVMAKLKAAPGRMEIVACSPHVLVDYAHTPDALENALITLNQLKKGKLWVVFGCGGDRDKSKRPLMGRAASLYADHVIITSDNPRTEEPETIINEIAQGVTTSKGITKRANREEAIVFALNRAEKEDIILIAGKGHEAYQQMGAVKHHFSDQEVVRQFIGRASEVSNL